MELRDAFKPPGSSLPEHEANGTEGKCTQPTSLWHHLQKKRPHITTERNETFNYGQMEPFELRRRWTRNSGPLISYVRIPVCLGVGQEVTKKCVIKVEYRPVAVPFRYMGRTTRFRAKRILSRCEAA